MAQVLPVEVDHADVGFQRQIERERVVVDDALFDVIQLTRDTCTEMHRLYTPCPEKKVHFIFACNSAKFYPIFKILLPSRSAVNLQ